jgi:maleylpyruvate isomerase
MKLHGYWRSSCSWRVRIALAHKKIDHEYVPVNLSRDGGEQHDLAYRDKNPMAQVPLLDVDEGGQRVLISQSLAILEYLEERWPTPPLLPVDRVSRARARELAEVVNSGIQPMQNLAVLARVTELAAGAERDWGKSFIARGLSALETLARGSAGQFLVGDAPSIADVCLIPQLYNARRFAVDLAPFATLRRVEQACEGLDAFAVAHADRQPDARQA